ncbi:hypothetical protein BGZ65_010832, partial [Modicella reniformis]
MANDLTIWCMVDGESTPFSVKAKSTESVDDLKNIIKGKKENAFNDVDSKDLTLWKNVKFDLGQLQANDKMELDEPMTRLNKVFTKQPDDTISIIVERPPPAKAYAEGWPMLYISDAIKLVGKSDAELAGQICEPFFALNRDILTTADLKKMVNKLFE